MTAPGSMFARLCLECTIDEDPAPWCDCRPDEQCHRIDGPCRRRSHHPDQCPLRSAWVPTPMRWRLVRAGDVVMRGDVPWVIEYAVEGSRQDVIHVRGLRGEDEHVAIVPPDAVVHVLVPLVERDAIVAARTGGLGPTVLDRTG